VEGAWDSTRGRGVLVAVLDQDFDIHNLDLEGAMWVPDGIEA